MTWAPTRALNWPSGRRTKRPGPAGPGAGGPGAAGESVAPSQQVSLTVHGTSNSLGGWGASGTTHLAGTLTASVTDSNGQLTGRVTNNLGVALVDTQVVTASGLDSQVLGTLGRAASSRLNLAASSSDGVPAAPILALPLGGQTKQTTERHEEAVQSLYDLGSLYSSQEGGIPVLVAFTSHPLYPLDLATEAERLGPSDAVVVPLLPAVTSEAKTAQLGPELVGSVGAASGAADRLGSGSLGLEKGGSFDYQFILPATGWAKLQLNFGSADGSAANPGLALGAAGTPNGLYPVTNSSVQVSAFDYRTGRWDRLRTITTTGQVVAEVSPSSRFLGPGGALEVRLSAPSAALNVYGEVPTLSAAAAQPPPIKKAA